MMDELVRIAVPLAPGGVAEDEGLWAHPVAGGGFRIANIPFSAYGIHLGDEVEATLGETGLRLARITRRSGHSTFRVLVWPDIEPVQAEHLVSDLESLGCGIERATPRWMAIDVPPMVDVEKVKAVLDAGWVGRVWRYEGGDETPAS